ncbi:MAG: N-acetylglucosamine-6-phosphate deacetylase [Cyclobacteriaceae bacterium]|nr:N-acetylglucosamine-6-phosphate deacetylase [Cyclobacteriaceae bacterium]
MKIRKDSPGILLLSFLAYNLIFMTISKSSAQESFSAYLYADMQPVTIHTKDGYIEKIERLEKLPDNTEKLIIAPGLIDNQVNGFKGVSFSLAGGKLIEEDVLIATRAIWSSGVTSYFPTLTTNDKELLIHNFSVLARVVDKEELYGSIPGYHLEGPYILPEEGYRGAHPMEYIKKPDWNEFQEFNKAAGGKILQITLAPEVQGAMDFISHCHSAGIKVALGHHNASTAQITEAIDRGAAIATHLGNGMANTIHRRINPLWPQLADDRFMISLIVDGFHLSAEQVRVFFRTKGADRIILTSDVTSYAFLPPGEYTTTEGEIIELRADGLLHLPAREIFYGAASPLTKSVGNIMKMSGCTLDEAIRMASTNVARLYGLDDRGEIKPGKRADLILFTIHDYEIEVHKTVISGKTVYSK